MYQTDRRQTTDDRETDHTTEKCVAIGEIACARVIPPRKVKKSVYSSLQEPVSELQSVTCHMGSHLT